MLVFTSITKSYLPKARVLARSLKRQHPTWEFQLVLSDDLPSGFDLAEEPFDGVVTIEQLGIDDWERWAFGHSVVELCTAVKGPAAVMFLNRPGVDKVMYLDPDIKVYNSLAGLEALLDDHDVLLTPHLLDAEPDEQGVRDNEIVALQHGVFNLGFFAVRSGGQGSEFANWWATRLERFCVADIARGLFTDQRWCDLAPCFFERLHIVRDRGCNVATWNVAHRRISKNADGVHFAGSVPLRFYHFTGYDSGDGLGMLARYASDQPVARELWDHYAEDLAAAGHGQPGHQGWLYGQFSNGIPIPAELRRLYRTRDDLRASYPHPFSAEGESLCAWWQARHMQAPQPATPPRVGWVRTALRPVARVAYRIWPGLARWRSRHSAR